MRKSSLVILLLLAPVVVQAWNWDTHRWVATQLCGRMGCGNCSEYFTNGSIAPDKDFRDTANHHAYNTSWSCPSGNWTCPAKNDFVAFTKAEEWLNKSRNATGCEKYYDIGVASHYWFDAHVFWHKVQNEDYDHCHAPFETSVGDKIGTTFSVEKCGVTVTSADFDVWLNEFSAIVGAPASTQNQEFMPPSHDQLSEIKDLILKQPAPVLGALGLFLLAAVVFVFKKRR
jgi:hypothetical protein